MKVFHKWLLTSCYLLFITFSFAQKAKKLGYIFDQTTYNFGEIAMWENQPALFTFTNKTGKTVEILPIFSEVDLEVIYPTESILPNQSVTIKAIFYTGGKGNFTRKFPIYFSNLDEAIDLKITGDIKSLSPNAYIQCPMSKPELGNQKTQLFVNVSEIETEIPLKNVLVSIVGLNNKHQYEFLTDKLGNFDTKMPAGNYEVIINHPNYEAHHSFLYVGTKPTSYLKLRLKPFEEVPIAQNTTPTIFENSQPEKIEEEEFTIPNKEDQIQPNENTLENPTPAERIEIVYEEPKEEVLVNNTPIEEVEIPRETASPIENTSTIEETQPVSTPTNTFSEPVVQNETPTKEIIEEEKVRPTRPQQTYTTNSYAEPLAQNVEPTREVPKKEETNTSNNTPTPTDYTSTYIPKEREEYHVESPYTYTPPEYTPPVIDDTPLAEKPVTYTISVIDESSYLPIQYATISIQKVDDTPVSNGSTDAQGYFTQELEKDAYKVIATAKGYEPKEIMISKNTSPTDIHRLFLKKKPKDVIETPINEPIAPNNTPAINEAPTPPVVTEREIPITNNTTPTTEPTNIPAQEGNTARLDSLEKMIALLQQQNNSLENELEKVQNQPIETTPAPVIEEPTPTKEDEKVEQMEAILAELLAKYDDLEEKLETVEEEKETLANQSIPEREETTLNESLAKPDEVSSPELSRTDYAANNVLFLIDVSSSMGKENKMELLQKSLKSMTTVLRDIDRVAIIAYNQKTSILLESESGDNKVMIENAIDSLETYGLTYGVKGLQKAYEMLEYFYIGDGNNQIILATDGLFSSVNNSMSENELNKLVRQKAEEGIKLSVIGFGKDEEGVKLMTKLAKNGEGQFIQIKNQWETQNILIEEIKLNSKK